MQALLSLLLAPSILIFRGYVITKLWALFVVPQFAVAPLRIPVAIGLTTLFWLLIATTKDVEEHKLASGHDWESWAKCFFTSATIPAVALLLGWIYRLFL